ncbi:MAG: cytochrome c peroxidase [bacterium]
MKKALLRPQHVEHLERAAAAQKKRRYDRVAQRARLTKHIGFKRTGFFGVIAMTIVTSLLAGLGAYGLGLGMPSASKADPLEVELRAAVTAAKVEPIREPTFLPSTEQIALGETLFFDKILSGNKDISCAGCHQLAQHSADALPLSIGTGGVHTGPERELGPDRDFIPRHSPDIFNRGVDGWNTLLWDGRIHGDSVTGIVIPESAEPIPGLTHVLAGQVMSTVLNRAEMRGNRDDFGANFLPNDLGVVPDDAPQVVWDTLMNRLMSLDGYRQLFRQAYPGIPPSQLRFQDAANAVAAFELAYLTMDESPFDRWLRGESEVLDSDAKKGAVLFYGKAQCAQCHSGTLMTDQSFHNIGVPQLRPVTSDKPLDLGRQAITGDPADLFAFRTPPLRNVALTAPYMHDGTIPTLEAAVRLHLNPEEALRGYAVRQLRADLRPAYRGEAETITDILGTLDPRIVHPPELSRTEMHQLMAFLNALTDPRAMDLTEHVPTVPEIPSAIKPTYE